MKDKFRAAMPIIIVAAGLVFALCAGVFASISAQNEEAARKEEERQEIYDEAFEKGYMAATNEYDDLFEKISPDWFHDGYAVGYDEGYDEGYEEGYEVGFDDGNYEGYHDGYLDGHMDGKQEAGWD